MTDPGHAQALNETDPDASRVIVVEIGAGVPATVAAALRDAVNTVARRLGYLDVTLDGRQISGIPSFGRDAPVAAPCPTCGRSIGRSRTGRFYAHRCIPTDPSPDPPEPATTYVVKLPYERPPLNLNDRYAHPQQKASATAEVRRDLRWVFRAAKLGGPYRHVTVQLHWRPARNGRRDEDNLAATAKVACDALVDEGLVPDDTPRWMTKPTAEIHPASPGQPAVVWITVEITNASTPTPDPDPYPAAPHHGDHPQEQPR